MDKCPDCNRNFKDGWNHKCCPKCGMPQAEAAERMNHPAAKQETATEYIPYSPPTLYPPMPPHRPTHYTPRPQVSFVPPPVPIDRTKRNAFIRKLLADMSACYGINIKIVFSTRKKGACHQYFRNTKTHRLTFGNKYLDDLEKRYYEYKSWRWLWHDFHQIKGMKAMWAITLHEFAHAIQTEAGKRTRGSVHNDFWATAVKELQELYPFEG